ncbi:MAG: Cystathionine beta-lyase PatB [Tenericutes bacterium ADurb.Bin087]|nr:MAG: Cystathionine beta-lyase PatB [Tenericutes bacterium ADurb.Bin087]
MNNFNQQISRRNTSSAKWDLIDDDVLPFSIADNDYATSEAIVKALVERAKHPIYGYTFPDDDYFKSTINWTKRRYGYDIVKDNIIAATGVVISLFHAIKFLNKDIDGVIVQTPVYNPFYMVIRDNNLNIIENPLIRINNHYEIDFALLASQIDRKKILLLCNPQNPTGRVHTYEELKRIVELAKKHNVFILSDEVHCDIMLDDSKFTSLNMFTHIYNKIIVFNSVSKSFGLAGLKTSNIIIRDLKIASEFREYLQGQHFSCGNLFGLTALKAAYNESEAWLESQNKYLANNYAIIKEYFNKNYPAVGVTDQSATYLAWLDFSFLKMPCAKMQDELLKLGVMVNDGKRYGENCNGFIRLNFACPEVQLRQGLKIIGTFIDKHK